MDKTVTVDGQQRQYAVFIPRSYQPSRSYPAIVFLHGLFEAGTDTDKPLGVGLGPVIARDPGNWPFIVIFPQSRLNWKGAAAERLVISCLDQVQVEYSVDRNRVILSGMSVGGRGAWSIGARHADRFAAIVPLAADTPGADIKDHHRLAGIPIWAFHNSADPLVAAEGSKEMCRRIAEAGGKVRYTQYRALGHDCWTRAYADPALTEWMLRQQRSVQAEAAVFIEP